MISFPDHVYAVSSIDASWRLANGVSRLVGQHVIRGAAVARSRFGASEIRASDRSGEIVGAEIVADLDSRVETAAATGLSMLDRLLGISCDARIVALSRYVLAGEVEDVVTDVSIAVNLGKLSFVATAESLLDDATTYRELAGRDLPTVVAEPGVMPIVWLSGSGGVLLHEAVGHAAEENAEPIAWPSWLNVVDDPRGFPVDDCGAQTITCDLLRETPRSFRRASFADVPARRMTNVVVSSSALPIDFPLPRIEVHAVGGGHYDAVSDAIRVDVSLADVVLGSGERRRAAPFQFVAKRQSIARRLAAASSKLTRYPGVICAAEGVRVRVGTESIDLMTERV